MARDVCWYCGGRLIWMCDYDWQDFHDDGDGIVTILRCSECGAEVMYSFKEGDDVDD